jgi:hypothetical protein
MIHYGDLISYSDTPHYPVCRRYQRVLLLIQVSHFGRLGRTPPRTRQPRGSRLLVKGNASFLGNHGLRVVNKWALVYFYGTRLPK